VPSQASPDQLSPDQLSPDQLSPDQLSPDQLSPDQLRPDQLTTDRIFEQVAELREAGVDAHGTAADLTDLAQVHRMMADVERLVGRVDILSTTRA
jgi:hypothetical protein